MIPMDLFIRLYKTIMKVQIMKLLQGLGLRASQRILNNVPVSEYIKKTHSNDSKNLNSMDIVTILAKRKYFWLHLIIEK